MQALIYGLSKPAEERHYRLNKSPKQIIPWNTQWLGLHGCRENEMCDFAVNSVVIWLAKKTASAWAYEFAMNPDWLTQQLADESWQRQRRRSKFPNKAEM